MNHFCYNNLAILNCRRSSVVEHYLAKVVMRVRFPSPAPDDHNSALHCFYFSFVSSLLDSLVLFISSIKESNVLITLFLILLVSLIYSSLNT